MQSLFHGPACALLLAATAFPASLPVSNARDIVLRSVVNTRADWAAAPQFNFTEHDWISKGGSRTIVTYRVLMIDGSPYNETIAIDNHPLSPAAAAEEERKLRVETAHRRAESPAARHRRLAAYQKERKQDHALMAQMIQAFNYDLVGQETVDGRRCFVLAANPRPGYQPINRDTKVLKGMRGKLWIDVERYQWVKVHAEVFRPVAFGLFIAHVRPGTEFVLEQRPVTGDIWLPSHFSVRVRATILSVFHRNSLDDEHYWDYRRATP